MEENEVEAAAGGMLEGLLLGWFLELGHLAADAAPIAVGVGACFLLAEVTQCWSGRRELRKRSKSRNLMLERQGFDAVASSDFVGVGSSRLDYLPVRCSNRF